LNSNGFHYCVSFSKLEFSKKKYRNILFVFYGVVFVCVHGYT